ncbi:MAG: FIVAR domain-containing protein, partial [Bacteroidales bacterium]|nr:FIVAR domain-containing protein [Bacteroidales bacterium]
MKMLRKATSLFLALSLVFSMAATYAFADDTDLSDSDVTGISGETCADVTEEGNGIQTLAGNITWFGGFTAGSEEELRELLESGTFTNMGMEITLTGDIELTSGFTGFYQLPKGIQIIGTDSQGVEHTLKGPEGGCMFTSNYSSDEYTAYSTLILDDVIVDCNGGEILSASYGAVADFEMHNAEIRNGYCNRNYGGVIYLGDGWSYSYYTDEMVNVTLDNVTTSNCAGTLLSTNTGDVSWNITDCELSSTANGLGYYSDRVWYVQGSSTEDKYTEALESVISNSTFSWSDGENGESFTSGIEVINSSVLTVKDSIIIGPSSENNTYLFTVAENQSYSHNKPNGLNLENCSLGNADGSRPVIDVLDREATVGLGSDVNGEPEVYFASGSNGSAGKLQISDRLTGTIYFDYGVSLSGAGFTLASAGEGYTITKEDRRCLQYAGDVTGYMVILDQENNELLFAQGTPADKTGLDEKIAEAEEATDKGYTTGSWAALQEALDEAKKVSADDSATQDEVTEAIEALDEAMAGLTEAADKSALDAEIARAEALNEKDYTADSWSNMQDVLDAAKEVSADGNADQDDVDAMTIALADAIDALVVKIEADKTALRAEIEEAESLNKQDYTEDSWSILQIALAAAKEVMNDESADQETVDEVLTDLSHAVMALQPVGVTGFMRNGTDGNWYYYVNGIRQSRLSSVVSGTVNGSDGWWYVVNGQVQIHYTGVSNFSNAYGWWYIKDGKVDFSCNSVEQNDYGWWYVVGGKVDFSYTGVANYANAYGWWYIKDGKVDFSKTSIEPNQYGWWRVVDGKVDFSCNSVEQNDYGWWY